MKSFITYTLACLWCWATLLPLSGQGVSSFLAGGVSSSDYTVNTAVFDGTNDFIRSDNQGGTGFDDGVSITASFWVKINSINTSYAIFNSGTSGSNPRIEFFVSSASSILRCRLHTSASTGASPVYVADLSGSQSLSAGVWYHVFWAVQTNNPSNTQLWVNGVEDTSLVESTLGGTADMLSTGQRMTVGANGSGTPGIRLNGSLAELWVNDVYLDPSTNLSKFYSSGPVNLGTTGDIPTGSTPCIYFSSNGSGDSWTNQGTAGTWTSNSTLGTDTSP